MVRKGRIATKKKRIKNVRNRKTRKRTKKYKGGIFSGRKARNIFADTFSENNHPIPPEFIAKKLFLHYLYGLNGIYCELPHPGQIFKIGEETTEADNLYVCVQSCIGELKSDIEYQNIQELITSGGNGCKQDLVYSSRDYYLNDSIIDRVIRQNQSPDDALFKVYKNILENGATTSKNNQENDGKLWRYFKSVWHSGFSNAVKKMIKEKSETFVTPNDDNLKAYHKEHIVYGIPLLKDDTGESKKIKAFSFNDFRRNANQSGRNAIGVWLEDNSKYKIEYDQEDRSIYNKQEHYGILDLIDNNYIEIESADYINRYYEYLYKPAVNVGKETYEKLKGPGESDIQQKKQGKSEVQQKKYEEFDKIQQEFIELETLYESTNNTFDESIQNGGFPNYQNYIDVAIPLITKYPKISQDLEKYTELDSARILKTQVDEKHKKIKEKAEKITKITEQILPVLKDIHENYRNISDCNTDQGHAPKNKQYINQWIDEVIPMRYNDLLEIKEIQEIGNYYIIHKNIKVNPTDKYKPNPNIFEIDNETLNKVENINASELLKLYDSQTYEYILFVKNPSENPSERWIMIGKKYIHTKYFISVITKKTCKNKNFRFLPGATKRKGGGFFWGPGKSKSIRDLQARWRAYASASVDVSTQRKNWKSRLGDTFLWLGNEHLYGGKRTRVGLKGVREVKFSEGNSGRKNNYWDSNTLDRLPYLNSYCTIIGYGIDIIYKDIENVKSKTEEDILKYGNMYKNNNLISGGDEKELVYERISSRMERDSDDNKYKWAYYEETDETKIGDYSRREMTPSKSCYYIVESKYQKNLPAKICKVYVDELQYWGVNYMRFSKFSNSTMRVISGLFSDDTTQSLINNKFNLALENWSKPVATSGREEKEENTDQILAMDNLSVLRFLPAPLYAYISYLYIDRCDGDLQKLANYFTNYTSNGEIVFRYPKAVDRYESWESYYLYEKDIIDIIKRMGEPRNYPNIDNNSHKNVRNFPLFPSELHEIFTYRASESQHEIPPEDLYKNYDEYINTLSPNFNAINRYNNSPNRYICINRKKLYDKTPVSGEGSVDKLSVYNFFPETLVSTTNFENYLNDLKENGFSSKNISDIQKYGININKWLKINLQKSNKFITTDGRLYMAIPSFLEITPEMIDIRNIKIFSFGYFVFLPKIDYDTQGKGEEGNKIYWHDRHIKNQEKSQQYIYAPLLFIEYDGKVYIPPCFFDIDDQEVQKMDNHSIVCEEYRNPDKIVDPGSTEAMECVDIRSYCVEYIEKMKVNKLLYIKSKNLKHNAVINTETSTSFSNFDGKKLNQYNSVKDIIGKDVFRSFLNGLGEVSGSTEANEKKLTSPFPDIPKTAIERDISTNNPIINFLMHPNYRDQITYSSMKDCAFYDSFHLRNAYGFLSDQRLGVGTGIFSGFSNYISIATGSTDNVDNMKNLGMFAWSNNQKKKILFFSSGLQSYKGDCPEFFKHLFFKHICDIKMFSDISLEEDLNPYQSDGEWKERNTRNMSIDMKGPTYTFNRWTQAGASVPLSLNFNMKKRIVDFKKCFSLYEKYTIDNNANVLNQIIQKMLDYDLATGGEKSYMNNVNEQTSGSTFFKIITTLAGVATIGMAANQVISGGGYKSLKKYSKMNQNLKKSHKKRIQKNKRTHKKLKRTKRKNKRTHKKKSYNP